MTAVGNAQGRPGAWLTYALGAVGLIALGGGCPAFVGMLLLWLLSSALSGKKPSKSARDAPIDDLSDGTAASDADDSGAHPPLSHACCTWPGKQARQRKAGAHVCTCSWHSSCLRQDSL